MRRALALAALAAPLASASSTPFWEQHEADAVYTSAALSLRSGGAAPFFATATWQNDPEFVGVFDTSTRAGADDFTFPAPAGEAKQVPAWQVVMSRHATERAGAGAVDTFAALGDWFPPLSCRVFAWASAGNGTPAWSATVPNCTSGAAAMSAEQFAVLDVSDDGTTAAFAGYAAGAPTVWVFDLQTGRLRFNATAPAAAFGSGPVTLSPSGAFVAWSAANLLLVFDGATGAPRAPVQIGGGRCVISDSGALVAARGAVLEWTGSAYALARVLALPADGFEWSPQSIALAAGAGAAADTDALVTLGYYAVNDDERRARVTMFRARDATIVADYVAPESAKLQTDATVRAAGRYAAAALWGDADDFPTVVLLGAGAAAPLLTFVTPGSMTGVDIAVDAAASNATHDCVYVVAAGKHVPANVMGDGGDAYAWRVDVARA